MNKPSVTGGYLGKPDLIAPEYFKAPRTAGLPADYFRPPPRWHWSGVILAAMVAAVLLGLVVADAHGALLP